MFVSIRKITTLTCAVLAWASASHAGEINWWVTEPGFKKAQELVQKFENANPGITVKLQSNPYGGLEGKTLIALKSGRPPDLMEVQTSWVPSYIATGALEPIGDTIAKTTPLDQFVPAAINSASVDGKLYALPFQAEALAMIYRKDLYRAAGLDPDKPPQTWGDMIKDAQALTKMQGAKAQYGYGIAGGGSEGQGNTLYRSLPYLWMNGGGILAEDGKTVIVNSPESVAAVKFYTDMFTKLKVSPPSTLENGGLELRRLFMSGAIASYQGTPTEIERFQQDAPNLDYGVAIMPHPEGKQTSALLGGWAFIVPAKRANKDDTLKLVQFLATAENVGFYTRTFPAVNAALDLPRFADPRLNGFKEMLKYGRSQPAVPGWLEISNIYYRHIQEILIGDSTPQEAMDAAAKEITAVVNR